MFITSYNEEFQWPKQSPGSIQKNRTREQNLHAEVIRKSEPIYRNSETLKELTKECLLPFDYLLREKPIVKTDPRNPYPVQELPKDTSNIFLTRPRVFKAPEISLDDINDPEVRRKIIYYTYSTTYGLATKDIGFDAAKLEEPISTLEEPDNIRFRKLEEETTILCETEGMAVDDKILDKWERAQSRAVGDPTTTFWTAFRNNTSTKLVDQEAMEIKSPEFTKNIINLARDNKLRLPYCLKPGDYAGYLPECPVGIAPEKDKLHVSDTMQTVYTLSNRWREH